MNCAVPKVHFTDRLEDEDFAGIGVSDL